MKRHTEMKIMRGMLVVALGMVVACGGEQSVASKSAAAYREAKAKGIPVGGGHEHGGHEAATATAGTAAMDHSAHGTGADPHAGHDMTAGGTAEHAGHGTMSATDHAAMGHAAMGHDTPTGAHAQHGAAAASVSRDPHAGMQHGSTSGTTDAHAEHRQPAATAQADHSQHGAAPMQTPVSGTNAHAQHGASGGTATRPNIVATAPRSNAEMRNVQPSSTLQPDAFDAPSPLAIAEAAKASRGITPGADQRTPATDHSQHGSTTTTTKPQPATAATVYTCPMHPEVTSDKPGTCPKCGMALVKKN
jgi:hypothetical protein